MRLSRSLHETLRRWQASADNRSALAGLNDHMRHDIGLPPRPLTIRPRSTWLMLPGSIR